MGVRRESKHEIIEKMRGRYRGAGRREKGRIIEEVVGLTELWGLLCPSGAGWAK